MTVPARTLLEREPESPPAIDDAPLLVILNPAAGRGRASTAGPLLRELLRRAGREYEWKETTKPGEAADMAARATRASHSRILLVGGDGTIADVAPALVGRDDAPPLALIPAGTGNDTAKTLGVFKIGIERALRNAFGGQEIRLDAGRVNGRIFVNGFGAGLDGAVAAQAGRVPWIKGISTYLIAFALTLPGWKAFHYEAELDGVAHSGAATFVAFANGRVCGGGFLLTPLADPCDGRMDACIAGGHSRLAILYHLPKAIFGHHVSDPSTIYRTLRHVSIRFSRPLDGHVDGNTMPGIDRAEVEILPGALAAIAAR